jgi:hypothetical protein
VLNAIMAKDLDGTGVTVKVLDPGGNTNTPMISDEAGYNRAELIPPKVMVAPLLSVVSDAAGAVTGQRFLGIIGIREKAGAPVTRISTATMRSYRAAFSRLSPRSREATIGGSG